MRSTLIDKIRADSGAGVEIKIPRGIDGAVRLFHQRGHLTRDFLDHEAIQLCHWNDTFVQKDKQRILLSSACLQPRTMADFARRWELDIARVRDEAVMREL